ncbi:hypothetical protein Peur_070255 [Populus x canadensis]
MGCKMEKQTIKQRFDEVAGYCNWWNCKSWARYGDISAESTLQSPKGQKLHAESETFIAFPEDDIRHSRLEFPNGLRHQNLRTALRMLAGLIATDGKLSESCLLIIKHPVTLQKSSMFP